MRRLSLLILFFIISPFFFSHQVHAQGLMVITEKNPDANFPCSTGICGYNADIVNEIIKRLNLDVQIKLLPWKRGYARLSNQRQVALFSTAYTKERAPLFQWCGPLSTNKYVLIKKKSSLLKINTLSDAKGFKIGTYADDVREKLLLASGFDKSLFTHLHGNNANLVNLKLLLQDRIDLWVAGLYQPYTLFKELQADCFKDLSFQLCDKVKNGSPNDFFETVFDIKSSYLYIAFSKHTPPETVAMWQNTLDQIKADGTYKKIMTQYKFGKVVMTFDKPKL